MLLKHLFESADLSQLSAFWKSTIVMPAVTDTLKRFGDSGDMLAGMVERSINKNAADNPLALLSLVNPLVKFTKTAKEENRFLAQSYEAVLTDFLNDLFAVFFKLEPPPIATVLQKVDVKELQRLIDSKIYVKLALLAKKHSRTPEEEQYDEEQQLYVFIGRPTFKEDEDGRYTKTLEIERLVPVDRFDAAAHQMVQMMKIRARHQGENSEVYLVHLPKGTIKDPDNLPDHWIELIDKHKQKVMN